LILLLDLDQYRTSFSLRIYYHIKDIRNQLLTGKRLESVCMVRNLFCSSGMHHMSSPNSHSRFRVVMEKVLCLSLT
jgi:hypothetical protein